MDASCFCLKPRIFIAARSSSIPIESSLEGPPDSR